MFDHGHLGNQVGGVDELGLRIAPGNDNVQIGGLALQKVDDFVRRFMKRFDANKDGEVEALEEWIRNLIKVMEIKNI